MNITKFGHLAFYCKDLARSVRFYRDQLGLRQKFSITYGDMLDNMLENSKKTGKPVPAGDVEALSKKRDKDWIVYMEIGDGAFIELFDTDAQTANTISAEVPSCYAHVSLAVEDIFAAEAALRAAGAPIDTPPCMGLENTWQMWSHDPDGNTIEFMQYTPASWQLVGKE